MKEKIHVHVADDHKILIDGIIALLHTEDDIIVEGYSLTGKQVVDWAKRNKADVLILDINMPQLDGIEVMQVFKQRNLQQKTIILSSMSDIKIVQEMISLGASGFIDKSVASEHIIKAIRTVNNEGQYFSDDIQSELIKSYTGHNKPKEKELDEEPLSEQEVMVLKMILNENSTQEIAEKLKISFNTVKTYRRRLFNKLKVKNVVGLAMYAVKNDIV